MALTLQAKIFLRVFVLGFVSWMVGLFIFILKIPDSDSVINKSETDAVIVLTGGSMRLEEGFSVFADLHAKKILISGAGGGVSKKDLLKIANSIGLEGQVNHNQIVIGSIAFNTISNAKEAKIFMDLHGYTSLRLVTSNYHMLRSNYIFKHLMPNITIIKHPVFSERFRKSGGYISYQSFKMVVNEYNKFIGTLFFILREG